MFPREYNMIFYSPLLHVVIYIPLNLNRNDQVHTLSRYNLYAEYENVYVLNLVSSLSGFEWQL